MHWRCIRVSWFVFVLQWFCIGWAILDVGRHFGLTWASIWTPRGFIFKLFFLAKTNLGSSAPGSRASALASLVLGVLGFGSGVFSGGVLGFIFSSWVLGFSSGVLISGSGVLGVIFSSWVFRFSSGVFSSGSGVLGCSSAVLGFSSGGLRI